MLLVDKIKASVRDVKDFPRQGIVFKDLTPVFGNPQLVHEIIVAMAKEFRSLDIDAVAAVEARGFIFGSILAHELGCRFIPVRKAGRLPYATYSQEYALEYGTAKIEIHRDALAPGSKVLIHDDLLATGGTAAAAAKLIQSVGGILAGFSFIINLGFLPGEENLRQQFGVKPYYLVEY